MTAKESRIAVYGAGAMGTVLGAFLTESGLNVDLITRNEAHVFGLREKGAVIELTADGGEKIIKVNALFPYEMEGEYDVIFLMTKQRKNGEILEGLLPYLKSDGVVCTTQNGLPEESVANVVGQERTYGAATSFGATFLGGGRVALTSNLSAMRMQIGNYENDGAKLPLLKEILSVMGNRDNDGFVEVEENLLGARWSKLSINAAFSGLSVVTGMMFGEVAKKRKTRKLALGILRECMDVANASGVKLAPMQGHDLEKLLGGRTGIKRFVSYMVLPFAIKKHKNLVSGMLKDVQNGRKCEIEFINGAVVAAGRRVGVPTPLCEKVVALTHDIENGLCGIDYRNVDFFNEL